MSDTAVSRRPSAINGEWTARSAVRGSIERASMPAARATSVAAMKSAITMIAFAAASGAPASRSAWSRLCIGVGSAYKPVSSPPVRTITTADGRTLALHEGGDPEGFPVLMHHGTPMSGLLYDHHDELAREQRIRLTRY